MSARETPPSPPQHDDLVRRRRGSKGRTRRRRTRRVGVGRRVGRRSGRAGRGRRGGRGGGNLRGERAGVGGQKGSFPRLDPKLLLVAPRVRLAERVEPLALHLARRKRRIGGRGRARTRGEGRGTPWKGGCGRRRGGRRGGRRRNERVSVEAVAFAACESRVDGDPKQFCEGRADDLVARELHARVPVGREPVRVVAARSSGRGPGARRERGWVGRVGERRRERGRGRVWRERRRGVHPHGRPSQSEEAGCRCYGGRVVRRVRAQAEQEDGQERSRRRPKKQHHRSAPPSHPRRLRCFLAHFSGL